MNAEMMSLAEVREGRRKVWDHERERIAHHLADEGYGVRPARSMKKGRVVPWLEVLGADGLGVAIHIDGVGRLGVERHRSRRASGNPAAIHHVRLQVPLSDRETEQLVSVVRELMPPIRATGAE